MNKPDIKDMKDLYVAAFNLMKKIHKEEDSSNINKLLTYWLTSSQTLDHCFEQFIMMESHEQAQYLNEFQDSINRMGLEDDDLQRAIKLYKKDDLPKA